MFEQLPSGYNDNTRTQIQAEARRVMRKKQPWWKNNIKVDAGLRPLQLSQGEAYSYLARIKANAIERKLRRIAKARIARLKQREEANIFEENKREYVT